MIKKLTFVTSLIAVLAAVPAHAHDLGFAGLLSKGNMKELPEIKLSVGEPLGEDMVLKILIPSGNKASESTVQKMQEGFSNIGVKLEIEGDRDVRERPAPHGIAGAGTQPPRGIPHRLLQARGPRGVASCSRFLRPDTNGGCRPGRAKPGPQTSPPWTASRRPCLQVFMRETPDP